MDANRMDTEIRTESFQKKISVGEYIAACIDIEKFLTCCEKCRNYGMVWSCPPFYFSVEKLWNSYRTLLLYGTKITLPVSLTKQHFETEMWKEQYTSILKPVKERMLTELLVMEREQPGSMALSAGSCEGCATCARKRRKRCNRPEYMRRSIESLGGDVSKSIALYFNEKLLWAEAGCLPEHFFLLGGLLMR